MTDMNWEKIVERAESRPKTVQGETFVAEVRFTRKPHGAFDEELNALKLPPGETLEADGDFCGTAVRPSSRFYAVGKMADWFETIDAKRPYKLRLKVLFGTGTRPDNPDFQTIWHGYLIEAVEAEA